jgi:hypothetical protein
MSPGDNLSEPVLEVLLSIPGARRAAALSEDLVRRAVELEARHERSSVLPVRNLGMRLLAQRTSCFVLLKDATFRPPGVPTVFLVEEDAPADFPQVITVDGKRFAVVGEEVMIPGAAYSEATIPLERSFVIFPERRRGPDVPCVFVLPPVRFPELEREASRLGIRDVVSISPSLTADELLREAFGFPPTNELATLLIGCNRESSRLSSA